MTRTRSKRTKNKSSEDRDYVGIWMIAIGIISIVVGLVILMWPNVLVWIVFIFLVLIGISSLVTGIYLIYRSYKKR